MNSNPLAALLDAQPSHPIWPKVEVRWSVVDKGFEVSLGNEFLPATADQINTLLEGRAKMIRQEKEEPYHFGYEPPAWDKIDWEVCRLRVRNPGIVLEVLVNGANGGGKSFFAAKRTAIMAVETKEYLLWCHCEDEPNSERVQQKNVYHYLPSEYKTERGSIKKTAAAKLNYNVTGGFTDNKFSLHNGTVTEFRFWSKELTTLEGVRPHFAWTDEEVPMAWLDGITRRLLSFAEPTKEHCREWANLLAEKEAKPDMTFPRDRLHLLYQGVHLITFTPKSGYTPTVRSFLRGATTIATVDAELLPIYDKAQRLIGYEQMPKLQYCAEPNRIVCYLHAWDNKHAGNWEGMKVMAAKKTAAEIKWWAYGVAEQQSGVIFSKFSRAAHVRPAEFLPKSGTWYHIADPVDGKRNWQMQWWKVNALGEKILCREWPQENDFIPGVGFPGPWAVVAQGKNLDGDRGPAQPSFGGGFDFIASEIRRVEAELGATEAALAGRAGDGPPPPIVPAMRIMDSRAGNTESMANSEAKTLIESMAEHGFDFVSAGKDSGGQEGSNSSLRYGYKFIEDLLAYDAESATLDKHTGRLSFHGAAPKMFLMEHCKSAIFSFENLTGGDGLKGACKDPMDCVRYFVIADPVDVSGEQFQPFGGGYY